MERERTILFVCPHGAAKSVIAAAHCQQLADRAGLPLRASAAGVEPDPEIPPRVVAGLAADGLDVRDRRPRRLTPDELAGAWRVVSLGCDPRDLAGAVAPIERWDDVPAVSADYAVARDAIVDRLAKLLAAPGSPGPSPR